MKKCNVCGSENEDAFTSCLICGSPLIDIKPEDADEEEAVQEEMSFTSGLTLSTESDEKSFASGLSLKRDTDTTDVQDSYTRQDNTYGTGGVNTQTPNYGTSSYSSVIEDPFGAPAGNTVGMNSGNSDIRPQIVADKKKILGIWAIMLAVTALALFLIFKPGGSNAKGGVTTPEQVGQDFIVALSERNMTKLQNLCPPFLDDNVDDVRQALDELAIYNPTFVYKSITDKIEYTGTELEDLEAKLRIKCRANIKLDAACDITVNYNVAMTYLGESYAEDGSQVITAIKYKGKWFLCADLS